MVANDGYAKGRLQARPSSTSGEAPVGLRPLELGAASGGYLYVSAGYGVQGPAPLVLLLPPTRRHSPRDPVRPRNRGEFTVSGWRMLS